MEPVRTCLGCRQRAPQSSLMRVVAREGVVVVDARARLSGRGAWVHRTRDCVNTATVRRAFARALRVEGALDAGPVLALIEADNAAGVIGITEISASSDHTASETTDNIRVTREQADRLMDN